MPLQILAMKIRQKKKAPEMTFLKFTSFCLTIESYQFSKQLHRILLKFSVALIVKITFSNLNNEIVDDPQSNPLNSN